MLVLMGLVWFSCDSDDTIVGGNVDIDPEPDPIGCEASNLYDWESLEFEGTLDGGENMWLAFTLEETTLFSINLNQAGFNCSIYEECDGEFGLDPSLYSFESNGNGVEVGIVTEGIYYLELINNRPNRLDFTFAIQLADIVYGCMDDDALNYDDTANVDDSSCEYNDCDTDFYLENFPDGMVLDCDGNCAPLSWVGDGFCDDGGWGIYNEEGELIPIYLWCEELNWDEGDCEVIDEGCAAGLIEDCNGICAPENWLGDGFCDDGSYEYNGNQIFFNCEEFNNDEGDCDTLQRGTQSRPYPNGRVKVN